MKRLHALVGAVCGLCFLYQLSSVLSVYFQYNVSVTIEERQRGENIQFPAVTVCVDGWIYGAPALARAFIGTAPQFSCRGAGTMWDIDARLSKDKLCKYRPHGCARHDMVFAPGIYFAQTMPELRTATTFSPPDIFDCRMTAGDTRCPEFNCTPGIKNTYYRLPSQQCFTIDVNAMHNDDPLFKDCPQQAKWELELGYRWSKESTMLLLPVWSYPIFVHQTGHCPPDKLPAVVLLPGKAIQVTVKQLRTIRLPSPYKSMCTDYKSMGSFPEFKGFLNHDLCMQKCSMELEVRHCGCVLADYEFTASYPAPTCDFGPTDACYNALMGNGSYDECKRSCTLPCEQVHYDVRMSSISDDEVSAKDRRQTFKLKLKYRSDVEDLVIYHPTLTIIELAAYTGAYLGIWLGTSVVTFLLDLHTKAMQHKTALEKKHDEFTPRKGWGLRIKRQRWTSRIVALQ